MFVSQQVAKDLDAWLMGDDGMRYTLDQLMEIAGLTVASCIQTHLLTVRGCTKEVKIRVLCGSGNNGGDGLVAARYLKFMGFHNVEVDYPKQGKNPHYQRLLEQLNHSGVPVHNGVRGNEAEVYVDCIVGFGSNGQVVEPWLGLLKSLEGKCLIAVDVPSGCAVDDEEASSPFAYDALISLTLPKPCAKHFAGSHYLGGHFVPREVFQRFGLAHDYPIPENGLWVRI